MTARTSSASENSGTPNCSILIVSLKLLFKLFLLSSELLEKKEEKKREILSSLFGGNTFISSTCQIRKEQKADSPVFPPNYCEWVLKEFIATKWL